MEETLSNNGQKPSQTMGMRVYHVAVSESQTPIGSWPELSFAGWNLEHRVDTLAIVDIF